MEEAEAVSAELKSSLEALQGNYDSLQMTCNRHAASAQAAEKCTADLEKKIAALKKQLEDAQDKQTEEDRSSKDPNTNPDSCQEEQAALPVNDQTEADEKENKLQNPPKRKVDGAGCADGGQYEAAQFATPLEVLDLTLHSPSTTTKNMCLSESSPHPDRVSMEAGELGQSTQVRLGGSKCECLYNRPSIVGSLVTITDVPLYFLCAAGIVFANENVFINCSDAKALQIQLKTLHWGAPQLTREKRLVQIVIC